MSNVIEIQPRRESGVFHPSRDTNLILPLPHHREPQKPQNQVDMNTTRPNVTENTPLTPKHHHHHHHNNNNHLPDAAEKQFTTSDHEKSKSHLTIFLTALCAGLFGYVSFMLLYPLLVRLLVSLFSKLLASKKGVDDEGDRDGDYGVSPLAFGFVGFFG